ncbi:MAG: ATP-binding cassette domain-containing protein [Sediminibacterium sp.]
MIQFSDIYFGYSNAKPLYSALNLSMQAGSIYGLLGKNGAGKSTLLKIMAGLVYPQKGQIEVLGANPIKRQPSFLEQVFFIPEEIDTPNIDVLDFAAEHLPFYPKFNFEQFKNHLAELEVPLTNLNAMSFGQKKKVWIALGLAANTALLILDEPTNGLDIPSKRKLRKIMAANIHDERCIVISTHQVRDLDSLIDRILLVDEGEVIANAGTDEITDKLVFKQVGNQEYLEEPLYAEDNLMGQLVVLKRSEEEPATRMDIELFFNASIANKKAFKQLFKN